MTKPPSSGGARPRRVPRIRRLLSVLGPGLVTGAADDDPSGVATYSQAGAAYGNGLLWTVPVTLPLMMAAQEICDRTVLATGDSLGRLIRRKFARTWRIIFGMLLVALVVANVLNAGADLMAIGQRSYWPSSLDPSTGSAGSSSGCAWCCWSTLSCSWSRIWTGRMWRSAWSAGSST